MGSVSDEVKQKRNRLEILERTTKVCCAVGASAVDGLKDIASDETVLQAEGKKLVTLHAGMNIASPVITVEMNLHSFLTLYRGIALDEPLPEQFLAQFRQIADSYMKNTVEELDFISKAIMDDESHRVATATSDASEPQAGAVATEDGGSGSDRASDTQARD